eukprot:gene9879-11593_t
MDGEHTPYENDVDILDAYNQAGSEEEFAAMLLRELDFNNGPSAISSYNGDEEVKLDEKQPNYLQPTMASVLPPFLGGETERVRNSYRTGSYNTIKRLPDQIQPGHIRQNRKQHITENLLLNSNNVFKPTSIKRNEPFHRPQYIGTDFDKMKNVNRYWQDEERVQTDSLSRKPFVITSRIRSKTEDIFHDPEYKFPGMGPGTGLKKLENMVRDNKDDDKIILEPGYVMKNHLNVGAGLQVKEWTKQIHAKLVKDWPQYKFRVKFTKSNELVIQFLKPEPGGPGGGLNVIFPPPNNMLNKYMHTLAQHGLACQFSLKKRGDRWNILEVEYVNSNGSSDGTIPTYGTDSRSPTSKSPLSRSFRSAHSGKLSISPTPSEDRPTNENTATNSAASSWVQSVNTTGNNSLRNSVRDFNPNSPLNEDGLKKSVRWFSKGQLDTENVSASPKNNPNGTNVFSSGIASAAVDATTVPRSSTHSPTAITPRTVKFAGAGVNTDSPITPPMVTEVNDSAEDKDFGDLPIYPSSYTNLRPNHINTVLPPKPSSPYQNVIDPIKRYYLTYSFYAPWIHTSHMNVKRSTGFHNRLKANNFGTDYHEKYAVTTRPRSSTEDSSSSSLGDIHFVNGTTHVNPTSHVSTANSSIGYNIHDSFRSDIHTTAGSSPMNVATARFVGGVTRDMKFNN